MVRPAESLNMEHPNTVDLTGPSKSYIHGTIEGDLWMGGKGTMSFNVTLDEGDDIADVAEALKKQRFGDFQSGSVQIRFAAVTTVWRPDPQTEVKRTVELTPGMPEVADLFTDERREEWAEAHPEEATPA